ncbi:hypothetical protein KKJ06_02080 [Xenorhabdus bovienii]|uniref:hypothetical protein n=1 Tax=Xenorhabdus bovienii TaxID=40576 RepID=UPI0023B267AE|nr:hypothetical protein [Xenorhabdus bovienii]MDE9551404.1 hypothetical protein [Xenorhabdus bovienii]MDE9554252.1 hypothetical protein [Xenorhabdus bovienii]
MAAITSTKISPLANELEVGQKATFLVILTSNKPIDNNKYIIVENGYVQNIKFDNPSVPLVYKNESGDFTATAEFSFTVLAKIGGVGADVNNDDSISFTINTDAKSDATVFPNMPHRYNSKIKVKPVNSNKIDITINKNADLVIGQKVSFFVELNSDNPIVPASNITIEKISSNIKFDQDTTKTIPLYSQVLNKASAQVSFTVLGGVSGGASAQDGAAITFVINTDAFTSEGNFGSVSFNGTANEIDMDSLALFVESPFLQMSSESDQQNPTAIYTYLKNRNTQKPLVGTPVFITSQKRNQIEEFKFKDGDGNNPITLEKEGNTKGLIIASKDDGLVKFYLYPQTALVSVVNLWSYIVSHTVDIRREAKQVIYAVNYIKPTFFDSIGMPDISGYSTAGIRADSILPYFMASVSGDPRISKDDTVLFFVNKLNSTKPPQFTGYTELISDPQTQLDQYSMKLPYTIFEQSIPSELSYTVVKPDGSALYSDTLPVTYLGGASYVPEQEAKRSYELCIVHPSTGVDPDVFIPADNDIGYENIKKYPNHKYDGLFIEIVRFQSNDTDSKLNPVPSNIKDITLNMYINSDNKSFTKSYTKQINLADISGPGNKDSIFFHIPYDDIVSIKWRGNISFDYQFFKDEVIQYSAVWNGYIGTEPLDGSD